MADDKYWQNRIAARLIESEKLGLKSAVQLNKLYDRALKNIDNDIQSLYKNYGKQVGNTTVLDIDQLNKALNPFNRKEFLKNIENNARKLGIDINQVYDDRYLFRLSRLDAIKTQIQLEIMAIAPQEVNLTQKTYTEILHNTYSASQSDLISQGIQPTFSTLNKGVVDQILRSQWYAGNYSSRIWGNTASLAFELPAIIGSAAVSGQSYERTARQLRERFGVSRHEALRLVLTESAYFNHQAEAQSYVDDGITSYTLDVTLDGKTSKICLSIDEGHIYLTAAIVVGENYPPLHPYCRTVPRPVLDGELKTPNKEDRTSRLEQGPSNQELEERFRQSMIDQMNPNKSTHDYNADLNIITQNFTGKELQSKLTELIETIPENYPLRDAIIHTAKFVGWKP